MNIQIEMTKWIQEQIVEGHSVDDINEHLKQQGYEDSEIQESIKNVLSGADFTQQNVVKVGWNKTKKLLVLFMGVISVLFIFAVGYYLYLSIGSDKNGDVSEGAQVVVQKKQNERVDVITTVSDNSETLVENNSEKKEQVTTEQETLKTTQESVSTPGQASEAPLSTKSNANSASDTSSVLGAKETYLIIHNASRKAITFEDLLNLAYVYGTAEQVAEYKAKEEEVKALPDEFKQQIVSFMVGMLPPIEKFTDVSETTAGDTTTLVISTSTGVKGTIVMVLENGVWKLEKSSWEEKISL